METTGRTLADVTSFAYECWPPNFKRGIALHECFLGGWGVPIGELFDLRELAAKCKELNQYTFLLTTMALNIDAGIGSPANAQVGGAHLMWRVALDQAGRGSLHHSSLILILIIFITLTSRLKAETLLTRRRFCRGGSERRASSSSRRQFIIGSMQMQVEGNVGSPQKATWTIILTI
jgi:hypothetical protein